MRVVKSIVQWLTREERLKRHPFLRRFFWKRGPVYRAISQRQAVLRQKDVITVTFMVLNLPCWKCDSLFRLMQQHPRFRPIIWLVSELQIADAAELQRNLEQMRAFFAEKGYPVAEMYSLEQLREEFAPDIVFLAKPYPSVTLWNARNMDRELVCYVPYCFQNGESEDFLYGQENHVWRNFYSSAALRKRCVQIMANAAENVVVTGAPFTDAFFFPEPEKSKCAWKNCSPGMKKIIWAPHWSVGGDSWFKVATFLDVAEDMLRLAEQYADRVQWAFKPHPLLRDTLYRLPGWGRERTDAYYERWASMPNTQLETGDYLDLFKQSDAMVHDSGSFIMEYLLVDKPCMYLLAKDAFSDFNQDTRQALDCYRKGSSAADIERFVLDLLENRPDVMAPLRSRYRKSVLRPPGGRSAAQNIIRAILKGR